MKKPSPPLSSIQKATRFLEELLQSKPRHLPSIKKMARDAGVATAAMHQAVHATAEKTELSVRRRGGITIGARDDSLEPPPLNAWQKTMVALEHDILRAAFQQDHLPPLSEMARRYGVWCEMGRTVV